MILNAIQTPQGWGNGAPAAGTIYVLECSYTEREAPKNARFRWHPDRRRWWTSDPDVASRLIDHASPGCKEALAAVHEQKITAVQASQATSADIDIPRPAGLDYLSYQKAGIAFGSGRQSVLLADEMGLGKTIQAIGYINATPEIRRVLVICPATLKLNWARELRKWLTRPLSVAIANGTWSESDITIINYDVLKKHRDRLTAYDLLIVDECHYLKNRKAQRTQQVLGKWDRDPEKRLPAIQATHRWFLTGTPIVNRPAELWTLIHSLDPQTWKSWKYFVERYCSATQTRWGWDIGGACNLDELQRKLRETIMVRRLKMDVLKELPPKRRQIVPIPADGCEVYLSAERSIEQAIEERTAELRARIELAKANDSDAEYRALVDQMSRESFADFTELSRIRHETALAKAPLVAKYCAELLESVDKLVVFTHHLDVNALICRELSEYGVVAITGDTTMPNRQAAVDRFQTDPTCRVLVGGIIPAGVGITLTAASNVVFAELDWVPGNITQAEDRLHRIGQTDSVTVYHVVLEGSIDEKLATTLVDKQSIIDKAMNGGGQSLDDATKPVAYQVECATRSATRDRIAAEAITLTGDQIEAIHEGLRHLALMDQDHARVVNGVGFSKIDGKIGHSLADTPNLPTKQAALGKRIALKYRRQLSDGLVTRIKGGTSEE